MPCSPVIEERREARKAERAAKIAEAKVAKEAVAVEAEALASGQRLAQRREPAARTSRRAGRASPASTSPPTTRLWHRFSAARTTYTRRRKQHFAELNEKREGARVIKEKLVVEAEELATSTEWGPTARAYRDLMTKWKAAGGAPKDVDDALWKRFRAAQDAFFSARDETNAKLDAEYASQRRGEESAAGRGREPCCR